MVAGVLTGGVRGVVGPLPVAVLGCVIRVGTSAHPTDEAGGSAQCASAANPNMASMLVVRRDAPRRPIPTRRRCWWFGAMRLGGKPQHGVDVGGSARCASAANPNTAPVLVVRRNAPRRQTPTWHRYWWFGAMRLGGQSQHGAGVGGSAQCASAANPNMASMLVVRRNAPRRPIPTRRRCWWFGAMRLGGKPQHGAGVGGPARCASAANLNLARLVVGWALVPTRSHRSNGGERCKRTQPKPITPTPPPPAPPTMPRLPPAAAAC